jgi:hypothetical protein
MRRYIMSYRENLKNFEIGVNVAAVELYDWAENGYYCGVMI